MIGQTISHYRILEKLGEGGMGVVYKAHDTKLDRDVALKFLPSELTRDPGTKERFIHEAKATSAIDHTNICTIHEISETKDGTLFIAMACYEGETLKKKLEEKPLKIDQVIDIAIQVAQGLSKAHEKGIVHRDIKPANILITTDGVVKILDFGLAKLRGMSKLTKTGTTVGTAAYMSPEQAKGETVDHRTDIWSLGVVLYEIITGQLPFKGEYEQAITYQIINTTPEPITGLRSGVPMELERIVTKCLQKNPDERYQTVADLIADFKHLQRTSEQSVPHTAQVAVKISQKSWRIYTMIFGLLIIVAGIIIIFRPFTNKKGKTYKSIAVLPFRNITGDKEYDYFSEGIAEDIRTQLSKIGSLIILSQQATSPFKNTNTPVQEISEKLHADVILEGSCQGDGRKAHVNVQLIDGRTGGQLWGETYDETGPEVIALQSKVALRITQGLRVMTTLGEKELIESKTTNSNEAYLFYLQGEEHYNRFDTKEFESAIRLFKKAIEVDSNYALAYAGLGNCYAQRTRFEVGQYGARLYGDDWIDSAIHISMKAISLNPNAAEGYQALGRAYMYKGWNDKAIEAESTAIHLSPNYYPAVANFTGCLILMGSLAEGLIFAKKVSSLNPVGLLSYVQLGYTYELLGIDDSAERMYTRGIKLELNREIYNRMLANLYLKQGKNSDALSVAQDAYYQDTVGSLSNTLLGTIYFCLGKMKEAGYYLRKSARIDSPMVDVEYVHYLRVSNQYDDYKKNLSYLLDAWHQRSDGDYTIFCLKAINGEKEESYGYLQKAIDRGWRDYRDALVDPVLENVRGDDRFRTIMSQVKVKVDEQRKLVEDIEKAEYQ